MKRSRDARRLRHRSTPAQSTDPEVHDDLVGPFDGSVDRIAGHGTFIAGLVHQACPDADHPRLARYRTVDSVDRVRVADHARPDHRAGTPAPGRRLRAGTPSTCSACRWGTTTRTPTDQLLRPDPPGPARRARADSGWWWSVRQATTRPIARATPQPSHRGPTAEVRSSRSATGYPWSPWALSTRTRPTPCSPTPARGCAPTHPGPRLMSTMPPFEGGLEPIARTRVNGQDPRVDRPGRLPLGCRRRWSAKRRLRAVERHVVLRTRRGRADRGGDGAAADEPGPAERHPCGSRPARLGGRGARHRTCRGQNRGCGAPHELHQAGLEALVGRRFPAARRLLERARAAASIPI